MNLSLSGTWGRDETSRLIREQRVPRLPLKSNDSHFPSMTVCSVASGSHLGASGSPLVPEKNSRQSIQAASCHGAVNSNPTAEILQELGVKSCDR